MSPPTATTGTATITTAAHTVQGLQPIRIQAHVDTTATRPQWSLAGLPDPDHTTGDRIRAAIVNSGQAWPQGALSLTVLGQVLPAPDTAVDLACALAILAAAGQLPAGYLDQAGCCGDLGLNGAIRSIRDLDGRIAALQRAGLHRLVLPTAQTPISHPGQMAVWAATTLWEIVERLRIAERVASDPVEHGLDELADPRLRRVVTIAAAGGHHMLLTGCFEGRATHLSLVLAGLLPDLDQRATREVGDIHWAAGQPRAGRARLRPPQVGEPPPPSAGTLTRPGPASLAHHGLWRPPDPRTLTCGQVGILRSVLDQRRVLVREHQATRCRPARAQVVLATSGEASTPQLRALADRIDLRLDLHAPDDLTISNTDGHPNVSARERIEAARMAAARRWSPQAPDHPVHNAEITPDDLRRALPLLPEAYLRRGAGLARLSARGWVGVLRLAWTIADLAGHNHPTRPDVDEAITWRTTGLGHR